MDATELAALLASPAMAAPDGVTPDFDNPPNRNALAWFVTTFCMIFATTFLCLRLYAVTWKTKKVRPEEVLMVLAFGAYWGTAYAGYSLIYTPGYYVHQWNLVNGDLIHPLYLILVYGCAYSACLPLLKVAILLDWNRIFFQHDKKTSVFWWGSVTLITLQTVWGLACIILLNMQCTPHEAIWEFYLESTCYNLPSVMLTSASVQVFTDIIMVTLPQRVIWSLQMSWQRKVGISFVFGVGLLACIAAIVRLDTTVTFAKTEDQMYYIGPLLFWACAEMTCGFFILCVPCLPKLISESSCSRRVKRALGVSTGKPSADDLSSPKANSKFSSSYASRKKSRSTDILNTTVDASAYYQIDEDAVGLDDLKTSESTEQLRKSHQEGGGCSGGGVHVTKTVVVTKSQSRPDSNDEEFTIATKLGTPWARSPQK